MARIRSLTGLEEDSASVIWRVLSEAQRERGWALASELGGLAYEGDSRFVEPETPALSKALLEGYGYRLAAYSEPPRPNPWALYGWDRRRLMLTAIALVQTHQLDDEQAAQLLALTLDVLRLQQVKKSLELRLTERIPKELHTAAIQRWAVRHGHQPEQQASSSEPATSGPLTLDPGPLGPDNK